MLDAGTPGWVLITEAIGDDPNPQRFGDYHRFADRGLGVIVRLNNGYEPAGTISHADRYSQFAASCAAFVRHSPGCHIWIIGNEMNHPVERPGGRGGQVITPGLYARCYKLCRAAIHAVDPQAQVLVGGVAPWNAETKYEGNPNGDWVKYFADILTLIGPTECDGFTLHTYTHGESQELIVSAEKLGSFPQYHYHFRSYRDFMNAVPFAMRHLPCYITEADQGDVGGAPFPWANSNTGWIKRAYKEIDDWNRQPGNQPILALILYRWTRDDLWHIEGKDQVIADFKEALACKYSWPAGGKEDLNKMVTELEQAVAALNPDLQRAAGLMKRLNDLQESAKKIAAETAKAAAVDAEIARLAGITAELEAVIAIPTPNVPKPDMQDVRAMLPRHLTLQYPTRSADALKRIIVHHTVTSPTVKPERIAEVQVNSGKPGITYHYLISGDGTIYWTQSLEVVTDQTLKREANADGVAVALAGNFTDVVPAEAQMDAAARLIAWLRYQYHVPENAVVGRCEIDLTIGSPGKQWLSGVKYKDDLLALVEKYLHPEDPMEALKKENAALKKENAEQKRKIAGLEDIIAGFHATVSKPTIVDMVDKLPKHPALLPYKKRTQDISHIVIHHAETPKTHTLDQIANWHIWGILKNAAGKVIKGEWPGIAYHYVIAPDGTISQTQHHDTVSYHVGNPNGYCLGVSLVGSFMQEKPPEDRTPTPEQLRSTAHLVAWLMQELKLPIERVLGHREVPDADPTACPGDQWLQNAEWKKTLNAAIQAVQSRTPIAGKQIEHYLLLWDHGDQWADADWRNAQDYIAHFRPTTGFSVADALQARHVTIVGGDAGVSGSDEERLRKAGVEVFRLAGANEAETRAKLAALVQADTSWPGAPAHTRGLEPPVDWAQDPWYVPPDWQPPAAALASQPKRSVRRPRGQAKISK